MKPTTALPSARAGTGITLWRIIALGARELRGGPSGFYVFIACVALGVMVITAVGSLSDAMRVSFERNGQAILGGDIALSRMHSRADDAERAWIDANGKSSESATMRTMARRIDGADQALVELKAVDAAYPLAGELVLDGGLTVATVLHEQGAVAADKVLLERLGLEVGDKLQIGNTEVTVAATIVREPDGIMDRLTYGPRVLLSLDTLSATGLAKPGALVRWRYALLLDDELSKASGAALDLFREAAKSAMPQAGFSITDRRNPTPQVARTLDRLRQFLTLIGLTALIVGGVGVANAVATFIERRRKVVATLKSLGARSGTVLSLFLVQVMAMACVGVAIGLALGLVIPLVLDMAFGAALPIETEVSTSLSTIALAIAYGFLVALIFALWPLGRAERISASALYRDEVDTSEVWPHTRIVVAIGVLSALLVGLAVVTTEGRLIVLYGFLALFGLLALFLALGSGVTALARRLPRPRRPELALALSNLGAPGGLTRTVVLSLGTGLTLLVAVALTDASLVNELASRLPKRSPDYFVLDIPKDDFGRFESLVRREAPEAMLVEAPMLRGRLVALGDRKAEDVKPPPEAQWVLSGDRGLTYADEVPEGSKLVKGEWWPKGYAGEPLVSFEADLAAKLGVDIGDTVTVNVLGRNITARIANLREVKWETLALNFVMVFSPNTLAGAPHNILATISLPQGVSTADEARLAREIGRAMPSVSAIRVKDAIDAFSAVFTKVMTAVRVAGGVTLAAGALVLAGALATAQRRRIMEAVVLKVLGATRRRLLFSHAAEYLLLAALTGLIALVAGSVVAYVVVTAVMGLSFTFSWGAAALALGVAISLVLALGGVGTIAVLAARPVPHLRSD